VFGQPAIFNPNNQPRASSIAGNRFLFTGREYLAALGLYDYRHRIYMPMIGRFLQTDPIRFGAGDVNLYRYVNNNAAGSIDPLGLETQGPGKISGPSRLRTDRIPTPPNYTKEAQIEIFGGIDTDPNRGFQRTIEKNPPANEMGVPWRLIDGSTNHPRVGPWLQLKVSKKGCCDRISFIQRFAGTGNQDGFEQYDGFSDFPGSTWWGILASDPSGAFQVDVVCHYKGERQVIRTYEWNYAIIGSLKEGWGPFVDVTWPPR
jgi:RHS repeat-associated protein